MQQLIKDLKIRLIDYPITSLETTYHKDHSNTLQSKQTILKSEEDNVSYQSGEIHLKSSDIVFRLLGMNISFLEIVSDDYFYLDIGDGKILKTNSFAYNSDIPIAQINIANGTLNYENFILTQAEISVNTSVSYIYM